MAWCVCDSCWAADNQSLYGGVAAIAESGHQLQNKRQRVAVIWAQRSTDTLWTPRHLIPTQIMDQTTSSFILQNEAACVHIHHPVTSLCLASGVMTLLTFLSILSYSCSVSPSFHWTTLDTVMWLNKMICPLTTAWRTPTNCGQSFKILVLQLLQL